MIKILPYLCLSAFCFSCINVYAGALDDLVNQKQAEKVEQKKQAEKQKQQKEKKAKEQAQLLEDIADCEQAVAKAIERRNATFNKEIDVFDSGFLVPDKDGLLYRPTGNVKVVDFTSKGVFLSNHDFFVYTKDTDYATGEKFRGNSLIYEKVGNYKYETITGAIRSIPAYKATSHKVSEINPKTYLKNKDLSCCQYQRYFGREEDEFKEVGVEVKTRCSELIIKKSPHDAPPFRCGVNSMKHSCFTNNHSQGANSPALCTGTSYKE